MPVIPSQEALARLRTGNERFAAGAGTGDEAATSNQRRVELSERQEPFAIILGCSDARVPAEIVFDQGLGDLFVIRVAGNIVAPSQVGSVEFAVSRFGTQLVVILGHSMCGAVQATLEELRRPKGPESENQESIVSRIRPSVETLLRDHDLESDGLIELAVRENIRASADHIRFDSTILRPLIENGRLLVVGAEYSLETGRVDFFDGLSEAP
jgi:carbonic anhydrase